MFRHTTQQELFVWAHGKTHHMGPDKKRKKKDKLSFKFCKKPCAFCFLFEGAILCRSKFMEFYNHPVEETAFKV